MNFILHFRHVMDRLAEEPDLKATHISLYIALFQHWNRFRFRTPLAIIRDDLMMASKIASTATYTRCLKDLERHGYLKYEPSYSPYRPSYVYMAKFEKGPGKGDRKAGGKGPEKAKRQAPEKVMKPEVNSINLTNLTNPVNSVNHETPPKQRGMDWDKTENATAAQQKKETPAAGRPQSLEEVRAYFAQQQSTATAAEKFYHYYEGVGWIVSGKAPMKNWKASARHWMMTEKTTPHETHKLKPGTLHTGTDKDYGEPL